MFGFSKRPQEEAPDTKTRRQIKNSQQEKNKN